MDSKQINIKNKLDEGLTFKISRFKEQIKKTKPHKHDEYFELILLSRGEGFHSIEDEKYMVNAPEVYLLKPGQLHFWQFTSIPQGFVIILKESEFDFIKENHLLELLRIVFEVSRVGLMVESYPSVLLEEILKEYQRNIDYSKDVIHGLLRALLGRLLQVTVFSRNKVAQPQFLYEKFQQLLIKECPRLHKVNEFADILNTTPQNLNAICRKHVNKTASEVISNQIMLEAKRYILHTDNTISEIADILSFSDTSNFVKFFKKSEGLTPVQFREQYFQ